MNLPQLPVQGWESALFDHLWQSTAVAIAAWLLTVALRNNSARIRYFIWMCASIKFLVPFQLLTSIGARWATPNVRHSEREVYVLVEQFSSPFQQAQFAAANHSTAATPLHFMPFFWASIAALWLGGCIVLLARWVSNWRHARAMVKVAQPACEGCAASL
jgi:bla regulator protein BlaR1